MVSQMRGVGVRRAGGEREGVGGDHRIARAGHVDGLARADGVDMQRLSAPLKQHHAVIAPRDEQRVIAQPLTQLHARHFQCGPVRQLPAEQLLNRLHSVGGTKLLNRSR